MFWTPFTLTATAGRVKYNPEQLNISNQPKKSQEIMRNQFVSADHIAHCLF